MNVLMEQCPTIYRNESFSSATSSSLYDKKITGKKKRCGGGGVGAKLKVLRTSSSAQVDRRLSTESLKPDHLHGHFSITVCGCYKLRHFKSQLSGYKITGYNYVPVVFDT